MDTNQIVQLPDLVVQPNSLPSQQKFEILPEQNKELSQMSIFNSLSKSNSQQYRNKNSLIKNTDKDSMQIDSTQKLVRGMFKQSDDSIKQERYQKKQINSLIQKLLDNVENKLSTDQNLDTDSHNSSSSILRKLLQNNSKQISIIQKPFQQGNLSSSRQNKYHQQSSQQSNNENIVNYDILNQTKIAKNLMKQIEKLLEKSQNITFIQEKIVNKQENNFIEEKCFIEKDLSLSIRAQPQQISFEGKQYEKSFETRQKFSFNVQGQESTSSQQKQLFSAQLQLNLARVQSSHFSFEDAQQNFTQSLKSMQKAKGGRHCIEYAKILDQMGQFYYKRQMNQLSSECFKESIQIKKAIGDEESLAQTLKSYGTNLDSLQLLNQSMQLSKRYSNSQRIAKIYNNIGNIHRSKGNFKEALQNYQKSVTMKQQFYGKNDPNVGNTLINIGISYYKISNFDLGLDSLKRALIIFQKDPNPIKNYYSIGETKTTIGVILNAKGKYQQALKIEKEALKLRQQRLGSNDIKCAYTLNHMGVAYYNLQRYQQALHCFTQALRIHGIKKEKNENTRYKASILSNMGVLKIAMKKFSEADKCFSQSLTISLKNPDQDLITYATALNNRGNYFRAIEQLKQAQLYYRDGLHMLKNKNLQDLIQNARLFYDFALLLKMKNQFTKAKQYAQKSLKIRIFRCGQDHPHTLQSRLLLKEIKQSLGQIKL